MSAIRTHAHDVHTGLRVMTTSIARPTSLPHENLPALPALAPVPNGRRRICPARRGGFPGLGVAGRFAGLGGREADQRGRTRRAG